MWIKTGDGRYINFTEGAGVFWELKYKAAGTTGAGETTSDEPEYALIIGVMNGVNITLATIPCSAGYEHHVEQYFQTFENVINDGGLCDFHAIGTNGCDWLIAPVSHKH